MPRQPTRQPQEITVLRAELKDLQLRVREALKDNAALLQGLDRQIARLLGEIKPRPLLGRIETPTGIKSRCAEIRKKMEPIR